jgi:large subunit ribosomal protein L10
VAREEKAFIIDQITNDMQKAKSFIFFDYKGLNSEKTEQLRTMLSEKNAKMRIVKNSFIMKSFEKLNIKDEKINEILKGTVAFAYSYEDAVIPAKALDDFLKENKKAITFKGAFLDNIVLDANEAVSLANIGTKEELVSKLLYMLNYPISGLVNALAGNIRNLLNVVTAIKEEKEKQA